jgi:hypothetical protein
MYEYGNVGTRTRSLISENTQFESSLRCRDVYTHHNVRNCSLFSFSSQHEQKILPALGPFPNSTIPYSLKYYGALNGYYLALF